VALPGRSRYNPPFPREVQTAATLEREIKLRFPSPVEAREVVLAAGATPLRGRRLQEDCLLDTEEAILQRRRCVLRVRIEAGKSRLTFKGPVQLSPMKLREELETIVGDGDVLLRVLEELGFRVWFRYQKYREEFAWEDVIIAIDETPLGTFIEVEGSERGITMMAEALGRSPADYLLDSYRSLYVRHCQEHDLPLTDMVFDE
jgi:adenylate cyclase class 2